MDYKQDFIPPILGFIWYMIPVALIGYLFWRMPDWLPTVARWMTDGLNWLASVV